MSLRMRLLVLGKLKLEVLQLAFVVGGLLDGVLHQLLQRGDLLLRLDVLHLQLVLALEVRHHALGLQLVQLRLQLAALQLALADLRLLLHVELPHLGPLSVELVLHFAHLILQVTKFMLAGRVILACRWSFRLVSGSPGTLCCCLTIGQVRGFFGLRPGLVFFHVLC